MIMGWAGLALASPKSHEGTNAEMLHNRDGHPVERGFWVPMGKRAWAGEFIHGIPAAAFGGV